MKGVLGFFFNTLLYFGLVAFFLWGLPVLLSKLLNTPYPMASITSGSMWPVLKEGDLIFIQGVPEKDLKKGDVIVWRNDKGFTIHRIVKVNENTIVTKGDANFQEDKPISPTDVVGKAFQVGERYVRIPYIGVITIAASRFVQ